MRIFRETYSTQDMLNQSQIISIRQVALSQDLAKFIYKTTKIARYNVFHIPRYSSAKYQND